MRINSVRVICDLMTFGAEAIDRRFTECVCKPYLGPETLSRIQTVQAAAGVCHSVE